MLIYVPQLLRIVRCLNYEKSHNYLFLNVNFKLHTYVEFEKISDSFFPLLGCLDYKKLNVFESSMPN